MFTEQNVHLLETAHLFLEIHQDSGTCNYYFADHGRRTIFWLHTVDTSSVRLPRTFSSRHLRMLFERLICLSERAQDYVQNTHWRKITGFMSSCSRRPLRNILPLPWTKLWSLFCMRAQVKQRIAYVPTHRTAPENDRAFRCTYLERSHNPYFPLHG